MAGKCSIRLILSKITSPEFDIVKICNKIVQTKPLSVIHCVTKRLSFSLIVVAQLALFEIASTTFGGNVLTDPSFESGLYGWTTFGNTIPNGLVELTETTAHGGTNYLKTFGQFISAIRPVILTNWLLPT